MVFSASLVKYKYFVYVMKFFCRGSWIHGMLSDKATHSQGLNDAILSRNSQFKSLIKSLIDT